MIKFFAKAQWILCSVILLTALLYKPGLTGPWLVDDEANLGIFLTHTPQSTLYKEIIFGNNSGPLGRPVSMATFAANHALNLFYTPALKSTNLLFHLVNGLLLFTLLTILFRQKNPITAIKPTLLATLLTAWWLLLPLHTSTVLYIVQRMTQVATLFSLFTCITWIVGRTSLQAGPSRKGYIWLTASLLICFPLAIFAKESAVCTLAWLLLIELFFFTVVRYPQRNLRVILTVLLVLTFLLGTLLANTAWINNGYIGREFSLTERLLTEPRILWTYVSDIFLPNNQRMGLFQDDYLISHSLFSPWTTLLAIVGLIGAISTAVWLSITRWWGVAFGILFYLAGHLIESTVIPLELYFEHRNYLPSVGLLLAATVIVSNIWPWQKRWLAVVFVLYLGVLGFSTLQRSHIWGDTNLLLETSALNHPHSLRAWSDYTESLLKIEGKGGKAALEAALFYGQNNPDFAGIAYLHMVSIYCRLGTAPDTALLSALQHELVKLPPYYTTPLSVGLQNILENKSNGACANADLSSIARALPTLNSRLQQHYGQQYNAHWVLRFTMAKWLLDYDHTEQALTWLQEIWSEGDKADKPTVGLVLAQTLAKVGSIKEMQQVLSELDPIIQDAPPDFREEMNQLRQQGNIPLSPQ